MLSKISLTAAAICAINSVEATGLKQLIIPGTTEPTRFIVPDQQSFIDASENIADQTYDMMFDRELMKQIQAEGVSLEVGESAKFILRSQASTGYRWFPDPYAFNNNVYAIDVEEVAPTQTAIGAYEQYEITITGKSAGAAPLNAIYKRYWERSPLD